VLGISTLMGLTAPTGMLKFAYVSP